MPRTRAESGTSTRLARTAGRRVQADPPEVKDLAAGTLRRQLGETLDLLGDHLALYQIHSATIESGVLDDRDVRDQLAELRAGGVAIGFTTTGPEQSATIDRALEVGGFDAVQATWNLLEPSTAPALARANMQRLRVVVKEELANGRLTSRERCGGLEEAASRLEASAEAVALAAALAQPWGEVVLSGAARPDQVRSNLTAMDVRLDDQAESALAGLAEPASTYWRHRSQLVWN